MFERRIRFLIDSVRKVERREDGVVGHERLSRIVVEGSLQDSPGSWQNQADSAPRQLREVSHAGQSSRPDGRFSAESPTLVRTATDCSRCRGWLRFAISCRRENLHDTEEPTLEQADAPPAPDATVRQERSIDGSYNDLSYPQMGCAGRRFGRNFPLEHTFPDTANLMTPSPRVVSRELMTRHEFLPATILNLHAASWIQFMVHDWFVHKRSAPEDGVDIPLAPGDDWPEPRMRVPRSVPDAAPPGSTRPPAYVNPNSHWWDGSQIYGSDPVVAAKTPDRAGRHAEGRGRRSCCPSIRTPASI